MVKRLILGGGALVCAAIAGLSLPAFAQSGAADLTPPSAPPIRSNSSPAPSNSPATTGAPANTGAPAQGSAPATVSSADLQKFARALQQVRGLQSEAQTQMIQALQTQGLTPERFNQIAQATQQPNRSSAARPNSGSPEDSIPAQRRTNISSQERQQFERAVEQLTQIQQETRGKQEQAVTSSGLSIQQFNQIFAAVRQNPQLQQEVMKLIEPSAPAQTSPQTPSQNSPRQGTERRTP